MSSVVFGYGAQAGDVNGDGIVGVVIANSLSGDLLVYYGTTAGISDTSVNTTLNTSFTFTYIVAARDLGMTPTRSRG